MHLTDREEVTKESDFQLNSDDDDNDSTWDGGEAEWANDGDEAEGDVKDENAAYLEFLSEEVGYYLEFERLTTKSSRPRNSATRVMKRTKFLARRTCSSLHLTALSRTGPLRMPL